VAVTAARTPQWSSVSPGLHTHDETAAKAAVSCSSGLVLLDSLRCAGVLPKRGEVDIHQRLPPSVAQGELEHRVCDRDLEVDGSE
jgi:hypothetical protein